MGILVGYAVARSVGRARARRAARPPGYAEFEATVLMSACAVGVAWPIHVGFLLTRWGLHVGWSIVIASVAAAIGLVTVVGYVVVGLLYSGIWLAVLIDRGVRGEIQWDDARGGKR